MSTPKINQLALGLFSLILIGGFVWWFQANYERVTEEVRSGMSAEAKRNPLLAAEWLLDRLGQQTESRSGRQLLIHPPEESGVMLIRDLGAPLPQNRVDELLSWVEAGGQLIVSPGRLQDDDIRQPLLESFGVDFIRLEGLDELQWLQQELTDGESEPETSEILLPGEGQTALEVVFDSDRWFEVDYDYEYWQAPGEEAPHLLIFALGEGYVTFLSDSDFLDNEHIGEFDHAPLLAELAAGPDRVWLLYSSQMPSLVELIWRWAPYLVVSLGLFTMLLIWRMSRRSGPQVTTLQGQRRDLLEHLQAAAEYNWRIDPSSGLLQQARKQVEKRWMVAHPQLQRLDPPARCAWLAERTGMTAEAIDLALYREGADGGQLVKITANLQRLLAALHPQRQKR